MWERKTKHRVFVRALEGTYGNLVKDLFEQPRVYKSRDLQWKGGPQQYGKKIVNPQSVKIAHRSRPTWRSIRRAPAPASTAT